MNLSQTIRGARAALPILAGICLFPAISPAPVFMKLGDIKGESTDKDHKDWIIIESISSSGIEEQMAAGLPTGKRQHKPLVVTKSVDKATPLLMELLATGETTPEAILEFSDPGASDAIPYYLIRMKKVLVSSIDIQGDADQSAMEELSLNFPYAEWHYQQFGPDGTIIDRVSTFFDSELNEAGPISQPPIIDQVGNADIPSGTEFIVDVTIQDQDTSYPNIDVDVELDPAAVTIGPVQWVEPDTLRIQGTTSPTYSGQTTITVIASDGANTSRMSFSLFIDSTGTPWEGFMQAYFTEEERQDSLLSSPIGDPDGDFLATILEFLLGTNPREFTPPEEVRSVNPIRVDPTGPDDDGDRIEIHFQQRIDEPLIRLTLFGSPDGETWTPLNNRSGDNPLYQQNSTEGENPLFSNVSGTVNPPSGAPGYFIRFVAEMN
jgi:type VI secretion system secreted protein Hcp